MDASLAERLGFGREDRVAIVHADDVGMCHAQNLGFFETIDAGTVTCGSVMVNAPWFPEVAEWARRRRDVDLGVHLCLNSEFLAYRWGPVVGARRVPTLVDRDGYFWPSPAETLEHADPAEAAAELRAQVDRALGAGIDVTHLDAHLGTPMMQRLLPVYVSLAHEFYLPIFFLRPTARLLEDVGRREMIAELPEIIAEYDAERVLMLDHADVRSLSFEPDDAADHYRRAVRELESGVTHLLLHPARADDELRAITPDSWRQRDAERRLFAAEETRRWFEEAGVHRIGYRPLRDLVRAS